jgi:hypothetical protein
MALDECPGDVGQLAPVLLGVLAQHRERVIGVDRMALHQDPLRLLDERAPLKCVLQVVVLGEALEGDVDRALELRRVGVDDVGEDSALGCLADVRRLLGCQQRDHRAARLVDDLLDQLERVLGALAEPDERDVGMFLAGQLDDLLDVQFLPDDLVAERAGDLGDGLGPLGALLATSTSRFDLTMSPVATASLRYMNAFSSPPGGEGSGTGDPVSWLQIEPGWSVVGSDGELVGSVVSVAGDKQDDIFDGLAISVGESVPLRYVPGEIVGLIFPGKVSVRFRRDESDELDEFEAPKPLTVWRPSAPSLGTRLTNWMRGRR